MAVLFRGRLDLTKRREELKKCVEANKPSKIFGSTDDFFPVWKYLYGQLIELEANNIFNGMGEIFEIYTNHTKLYVYTLHLSGARAVKVFSNQNKIDKDKLEMFCKTYGLILEVERQYGEMAMKYVICFSREENDKN